MSKDEEVELLVESSETMVGAVVVAVVKLSSSEVVKLSVDF